MWQNAFKPELIDNLRRVSNDFSKQLYIIDIAKECIMYSCDMCLEYSRRGSYTGISRETINNITYNVCVAMNSIVKEFGQEQFDEIINRVNGLMSNSTTYDILQQEINKYYNNR